jgi:hypothetical protein
MAGAGPGNVVFNEVMADPVSEATGEFIELYNAGADPVDVSGWILSDAGDTSDALTDYLGPFDAGAPGTVIPAGGFALVVDPDYAGEYHPLIEEGAPPDRLIMLTIRGDRTLGNGLGNAGDALTLSDRTGVVARFAWSKRAGAEGLSWEKKLPAGGDEPDNWAPCRSPAGATPGFANSVTPPRRDAGLQPGSLRIAPETPHAGDAVTVSVWLRNEGLDPAEGMTLHLFIDGDGDSVLTGAERIEARAVPAALAPGDSLEVNCFWMPASGGAYRVAVQVTMLDDEHAGNDVLYKTVRVAFPARSVVINEIMFDPGPERPEWIELYNRSGQAVDLAGWMIANDDTARFRVIGDARLEIPSGGYLVLAEDEAELMRAFPGTASSVARPRGGWPALRNAGSHLTLRDLTGQPVETVAYAPGWSTEAGRSAERLHPDGAVHDTTTWGPSAAPEGGTPGAVNTLFALHVPDRMTLDIRPNPFSPDGDGQEDATAITMRLPAPYATVRAVIFDVAGRTVRTLLDAAPSGSLRILSWDGTDEQGRRLDIGPYILYCEAIVSATGRRVVSKRLIVVAKRL